MIETLAELVAPLSTEEFRAALRDRRLLHLPGNGADRLAGLLDWDTLMQLVTSGAYPASKLRVTQKTQALPSFVYRDGDAPRADAIRAIMSGNGSVLAHGICRYHPPLTRLREAMEAELGEKIMFSPVATIGTDGAVSPHFDKSDAIAVQIEGSKRWLVYADPVIDPVPGMRGGQKSATPEVLMDIVMEPGDMLIVPSGYLHRCETPSGRSLHATFFIYPMTAPRMLDLLFREMVEDEAARAPVRFAADDAAAQAELRERILSRVRDMPFDELLARHLATDHAPGRSSD